MIFAQQNNTWKIDGNANLSANCFIGTTDPHDLVLRTNSIERLKISSLGQVAVAGLAGSGYSPLVVDAGGTLLRTVDPGLDSTFACGTMLWDGDGNAAGPNCRIGTTNPRNFRIMTNGVERMVVTASGNVVVNGFDAKAPFQVLDHLPITFSRHDLSASDALRTLGFNVYKNAGTPYHYHEGAAGHLEFDVAKEQLQLSVAPNGQANSKAYYIPGINLHSSGKVGIGTTKPQAFVHVYDPGAIACLRVHSAQGNGKSSLEFWTGEIGTPSQWRPGFILSDPGSGFDGGLRFYTNGTGIQNMTGAFRVMELRSSGAEITPHLGIGQPATQGNVLTVNGWTRINEENNAASGIVIGHDGQNAIIDYQDQASNNNNGADVLK
ncbi:MAG: hypothetical protein AAF570_21840, partial [Bacteroidota bacterium]